MLYAKCKRCDNMVPIAESIAIVGSTDHWCNSCYNGICGFVDSQFLRPSWDEICMDIAKKLALRSTCKTPNRQVGCVITTNDYSRILSWGYNGGPSNLDEECDYDPDVEKGSRCQCAHAEMNALTKLDSGGYNDLIMYVTLQPCKLCSTLIINTKCISQIVYLHEYRDKKPIFSLEAAGITVRKFKTCIF